MRQRQMPTTICSRVTRLPTGPAEMLLYLGNPQEMQMQDEGTVEKKTKIVEEETTKNGSTTENKTGDMMLAERLYRTVS